MKKIVSRVTVILFVILLVASICAVTSMECLKGKLPIQDTIINNNNIINNVVKLDAIKLPYKQIPLFYIGLILVIISSIICFEKSNKFKGLISAMLSVTSVLFVIITHNYLWFLILINLYLIVTLIIDFTLKNKIIATTNIIGIIIIILNIVQLIQHLQLTFNPSDVQAFETELVKLSDTTLKTFILWLIPYAILLINDTIKMFNKYQRTSNDIY